MSTEQITDNSDIEEEEYNEEEDVYEGIADEEVPEGLLRSIWIGDFQTVEQFLNQDNNLDLYFERVGYPLHLAVFQDRVDIIELLLKRGANADQKGALDQTPLHYACQSQLKKVFDLIMNAPNVNYSAKDSDGDTPLIVASRRGHPDYIKELLDKGVPIDDTNNLKQTAVHTAAIANQISSLKVLIEANANISLLDCNLKSPFILACENGACEIAAFLQSCFYQSNNVVIDPPTDD